VLGEIVVTAEKLSWLIKEGEAALKPSQRGAGVMVSSGVRAVNVGCSSSSSSSCCSDLQLHERGHISSSCGEGCGCSSSYTAAAAAGPAAVYSRFFRLLVSEGSLPDMFLPCCSYLLQPVTCACLILSALH
jgi:hypothetical protein